MTEREQRRQRKKGKREAARATDASDDSSDDEAADAAGGAEDAAGGAEAVAAVRTLAGGIVVEDLVVGSGAVASHSSSLEIAYEAFVLRDDGTLRSGGSIDKATAKDPYSFVCGGAEGVKGLSLGIKGMRVGGKRVITAPWKFGYGAKGSLPKVPPKANLRFDVTLLEVGGGFAI